MRIIKRQSLIKKNRSPWKFAGPSKNFLLPIEKVYKKSKRKNWRVIDIRLYEEYNKSHIVNSTHVSFFLIRSFIENQSKKIKIILITRTERSFLYLVPWAKAKGHKVYLLKGGFNKNVDSIFIKHKKETKKQGS